MSAPHAVSALSALTVLFALAACSAPAPPPGDTVQVFKSRGAVQCGARGTPPEAMRAELERAGLRVRSATCGSDGRMRAAVCGAGTDEINVFEIAASDLARAQGLGLTPLAPARDAQVVPCR